MLKYNPDVYSELNDEQKAQMEIDYSKLIILENRILFQSFGHTSRL